MSLSKAETNFLTTFAAAGKRVFTYRQAAEHFQSAVAATNTLGRLVRKGWLQRLERGLYLIIPLEAGPDRLWSENAWVLASHLVEAGALAYWSALRFWNLTDQLPRVQFIQTTRRKQPVTIQGIEFRFVHVTEAHFFGLTTRQVADLPVTVTDPEKTILDAASRLDCSGGVAQLAQALQTSPALLDWEKVDQYLLRWGGGVVAKRLGYLVETLALPIPGRQQKLARWRALISRGISQLEPGAGSAGPIHTRWGLQINVQLSSSN